MAKVIIDADLLSKDAKEYAKNMHTTYSAIMLSTGFHNSSISNSKFQYLRDCAKEGKEVNVESCEYGSMEKERLSEICKAFKLSESKYIVEEQKTKEPSEDAVLMRLANLEQAVINIGKLQVQMCNYLCEIISLLK